MDAFKALNHLRERLWQHKEIHFSTMHPGMLKYIISCTRLFQAPFSRPGHESFSMLAVNHSPHCSQVGYPLVKVHIEVGDSLQIE